MIKFLLKIELAKNDMTQKRLSELTGIRPPTISAICNNSAKYLPIKDLNKICAALKCQPCDIITYKED